MAGEADAGRDSGHVHEPGAACETRARADRIGSRGIVRVVIAHWTTLRRKSDGLEPSRDESGARRSAFGESHGRSPRDGHHETRSPEQNEERPRPATG